MSDLDETRQVENLGDSASLRGVVNPLKTRLEMTQGKMKLSEYTVHNGEINVAKAAGFKDEECTWLYLHAETRDGMNITLTRSQTEQLRDLLTEVLELQGESNE
jgi:hypothetical protein